MQHDKIPELHALNLTGVVPSAKRIFVAGTWSDAKAEPFKDQARAVGFAIGAAGLDLACGPGTGVAAHAIDGFRDAEQAGSVDFFLPAKRYMDEIGEVMGRTPDRIIETNLDYVMRNVLQVGFSDGVVAISGGDGTLEELLPALIDYHLPVGVVSGSGAAARSIASLAESEFPDWLDLLFVSQTAREAADAVISAVLDRGDMPSKTQPFI